MYTQAISSTHHHVRGDVKVRVNLIGFANHASFTATAPRTLALSPSVKDVKDSRAEDFAGAANSSPRIFPLGVFSLDPSFTSFTGLGSTSDFGSMGVKDWADEASPILHGGHGTLHVEGVHHG